MSIDGHSIAALLFHDRGPVAWTIVASYFLGAAATFWAGRSAKRRDRIFWLGTSVLLVVLGLNKELDLQTLLTTEGRAIAQYGGWYEQRRAVQGLFLLALAVIGFLGVIVLARWLRKSPMQVKAASVGIVLLFLFVAMRAGSFHHLDKWVTLNVAGVPGGRWFELAGILVIGLSAVAYRMRPKRR